jgi:hypothetical protein
MEGKHDTMTTGEATLTRPSDVTFMGHSTWSAISLWRKKCRSNHLLGDAMWLPQNNELSLFLQ